MNSSIDLTVIGAGLAGCEAAWQAAKRGLNVRLYEMKPAKYSPAHKSPLFAELVCSNSLRSNQMENAVGLLKEELRLCGSLIMEAALESEVPAGSALAVDREKFSSYITDKINNNPNIEVVNEEIECFDDSSVTIVATGPLTSEKLSSYILEYVGEESLHFFDAAAPIIDRATVNMDIAYYASRYGKGEASYLNCPFTKEEYDRFYEALISAEEAPLKDFDREQQKELTVFEGCMPIEVMAKRGYDTLRFGPMKPVGLENPKDGKEPYAVVQLRQENAERTMYNIVGFQTHLTFPEQRRVFGMIPGLENAGFLRYGVMHRNTFINSPRLLDNTYAMRCHPNIYFAGQITGVEGYVESTASGFTAGLSAAKRIKGDEPLIFPNYTAIGALASYVSDRSITDFQPMNINFGIMAPLNAKVKGGKAAKHAALASRSLDFINSAVQLI